MSAAHDHMKDVALLRELHSKSVPLHQRIAQIIDGSNALATDTKAWSPFAPSGTQIDTAIAQASGLATAMRLLRSELAK
jgi:hypothetical protein